MKMVGFNIWNINDSVELITEEKSKYIKTESGRKILKTNINKQPKSDLFVELGIRYIFAKGEIWIG